MKSCKNCGGSLEGKDSRNLFCSQSCAAAINNRGQLRNKLHYEELRKSCAEKEKREVYNQIALTCRNCKDKIPYERRWWKTCSDECLKTGRQERLQNSLIKKKQGGLRERPGRGRSGWYKGFYCNSTYELAYVIYCLDHSIQIQRNLNFWEYLNPETGKISKYYPDFLVEGSLIEVKGYMTPTVKAKLAAVPEGVTLLMKGDLQKTFTYVERKTGLKVEKIYQLYEKSVE